MYHFKKDKDKKEIRNTFIKSKLEEIANEYDFYEDTIKSLKEENKKLRDEHYKDAELAAMRSELDNFKEAYYRGFPLTKEESDKIKEWKKKHDTKIHNNPSGMHGVSGGGFAYIFYPTAIGTLIKCRCNICHEIALNYAVTNSMVENEFDSATYNEYMREHNALIEIDDF